ncbi:A-kinase anchor protein 1, mitochondrial [Ambystoma mexicanum]|uniref:A-kinase anchor protein 1, mitochondrial n=1 Tax=Ambystoma mexicanum TaxID=8296 RepID=UPI0037E7E3D7
MALQFRGIFPYTISGVLAIIGWWWFFSRKKNRMANQPDCPIANGQEQHAEKKQKDYIPAEVLCAAIPFQQRNREDIPPTLLSQSRLPSFGTQSEFSFETSNVSKSEDVDEVIAQDLPNYSLSSEIAVLLQQSNSQETLSNPLECSKSQLEEDVDCCVSETVVPETAMFEELEVPIDNKYPEKSMNPSPVPSVVFQMDNKIDHVASLKATVSSMASKEMFGVADSSVIEIETSKENIQDEVQSSVHTEILPQERKFQNVAVENVIDASKCTDIVCLVNTVEAKTEEKVAQCIDLTSVPPEVVFSDLLNEKYIPSSGIDKGVSVDIAQRLSLEDHVELLECKEIALATDAEHFLRLDTNLVQPIECFADVPLDTFDHVTLIKPALQNSELADSVSATCSVNAGLNEIMAPCLTQCDSVISADEEALTNQQETLPQDVTDVNVYEGPHTAFHEEKAALATEIQEIACADERKTILSIEFKDVDVADEVTFTLIEKTTISETKEIVLKEEDDESAGSAEKEIFQLPEYTGIRFTDDGNNLLVEKVIDPTKFTNLPTTEQCTETLLPEEKIYSAEQTKMVSSVTDVHNINLGEKNVLLAVSPVTIPKDGATSVNEETQSTECNTTILTENVAEHEFRKPHSALKETHISAGAELTVSDIFLTDNEEESIVVGMLLNSYVDSTPLLRDENVCAISAFSQCLGKEKHLECTEPRVQDFQKAKETEFLKTEAEAIEHMAMRIVSQVILAATREILSGAVVDITGISCHVLENEVVGSLGPENGVTLAGPLAGAVHLVESNRQTTIVKQTTGDLPLLAEENLGDDTSVVTALPLSCSNEATLGGNQPKSPLPHIANVDAVSALGESFEELCITAEDSGCSACASEDGSILEERLQSTALSSTVSTAPHFDTSDIADGSTEGSATPAETLNSKVQDHNNVSHSNGELRRKSPEGRNEGHWSIETDADHSGGSDVNSMDSVDSGCALGRTESHQDPKPGLESKKSDLTVWEIEVPKHLVGRLIGKQGRYVSFLKQTSGAKIYISTLPYTQEFQICHVEGSQLQVDKALNQIGKKFKELNLTNIYAPPPMTLPSLPMTSWLMLPDGVTVEVIVVNVVNAGHMFVQQHTHPTFHALRSLDQQMFLCYSQPGIPVLPTPVEVGVICAAPGNDKAWWRAQVVSFYKESNEVEIRYVDYGGYERVQVDILRQIRSDFVTLPFQGSEVLLDSVIPLPDEDHFSSEADVTVNEMTRGTALLAQVTNYDGVTGLPLIQLWSMLGDEVVSINRALVERGFAQWIDGY